MSTDRSGGRPLRITVVAPHYHPSLGGAQSYLRRVAEGLADRGHDVHVETTDCLRSPTSASPGRIEVLDEVVGGVAVRRHRTPRALHRSLRTARRAAVAVRRMRARTPWPGPQARGEPLHPALAGPWSPGLVGAVVGALRTSDVVVGCPAPSLAMVLPATWSGRAGAPARVVGVPLLHAIEDVVTPRAVRRALARAGRAVVLTSYERDRVASFGLREEDVAVLPPGVDAARFAAVEPAEARRARGLPDRPTVGYIGRLATYKGIDTLLDAAPLLWRDRGDVTLLIAGSPAGFDVASHARRRGLDDERLVLRGPFDSAELPSLVAACDVVAFPSREESFGMATIEAWAARRPVVAADIPAAREVIRPGVDGELVPAGDHEALAAALGGLLADPRGARAMGEAGRQVVEASLDWELVIDGWERYLAAIPPSPGPRRARSARS